MDVTSPAENCQMDSISPKETTTGEKHTPLPNEPSKTMVRGSVAQNCPTTEGSIWEQNETGCNGLSSEQMDKSDVEEKCHKTGNSISKESTLGGKPEHNAEFLSSEPRGKSDAEEKCHVTGNSISIESALGGKREHDTILILGEPMEIENAGSNNADSSQMRGSCHDELCSERIQSEQMDTGIVGSDFVDAGLSSIPLMFETQNFNELGHAENTVLSESKESTLGGKLDVYYELLLGEPMQTTNAGSSAHNSCMSGTSHNEHCSEHARGEPLKTRTVGSDSTDPGSLNTPLMCETQNSNGLGHTQTTVSSMSKESTLGSYLVKNENPERDSELVTGEPMETGSAGCSTYNSQTMGTLQNELGSVYVQGEPMETKTVESDAIDVLLSNFPLINETQNSSGHGHTETTVSSRPRKRKSLLESSLATPRVLRPRVNGLCKPPEQSGSSANVSAEREKRRIKRKRTRELLDNEYSKTRKRLRYLLTRMGYERNFIDAYSGEGWKGQSAEKIKPEKELQRATSEILRCKRRIRELFQHLDSLCAEGRFQESLFDSEGLISSEDIFCAKCASKDLSADNDIILCDGFCDRGFHQMCLEPPMLKEEIPPGDEGWLCPGCDCKIDCIDVLNDSQGTNLSIDDSWEKVFPEAAATEAGDLTNEISGLPSDDSEDYEYDPDASDMKEGVHTEGSSSNDSSSDDSDFTSASDDLEVRPIEDQYMDLPSDDSEDDEYDPNAPDLDETKAESSSSDFTSASEYFSASSDANGSSGAEEALVPGSSNRRSKMARSKKQSVSSELLSILEPNSQGDPSPVVGKRQCERLDYKKLHDEAYGNVSTDSSDDQDWSEAEAHPKKSDDGVGKESSLSPKVNSQTIMCRRKTKVSQRKDTEEISNTSKRITRQNKDSKGAISTAIEICTDTSQPEFIKNTATPTVYNTLSKSTTKRLKESFKENEYPTRATRENLAKELGMTIEKVTKWFGSARWSLRHSSNNGIPKRVSQTKDQAAHKLSNDVDSNNVAAQETEKASAAQTSRNGNNRKIDVVHRSVNKILRNNKDKKIGEHVEPETGGLPNDVDSKSVQDQELGDAGTPKTLKNDVVQRNQQTLNEASSNEKDQTTSKLVEPETKILHADVHNYNVEDQDLSEAVTPKMMNGTDVNGNLDDQTLNEPSSERILVVSIPAISPKTQKVRGRGRKINQVASPSQIQTRSKKVAAPTD